ncbi:hypothetical protein QF035_000374 [Streptomyces umbrinus]|uniref:Uncharacterized protein n=1 Tax=Streptomyces umbrinus TaxID=67370 RepID=A0ABU0SHS3_9ACTN|nr:hypothetical protein [Streptomyces umbrinus]
MVSGVSSGRLESENCSGSGSVAGHSAGSGLVDCRKRMCWPVQCYGEVGRCGERSTSRVISLGAKTRNGGPQKPVPRLV